MHPRTLLAGQWRTLVMLSYAADPAVLRPFVPAGTELDEWNGQTLATLVGFEFLDARLCGLPFPFHRNFPEVNLRTYVRRRTPDGWRRGVVFIKEIAPRLAVALTARLLHNQNFYAWPVRREITRAAPHAPPDVKYHLRHRSHRARLRATGLGEAALPAPGSLDEFILENYWAYGTQRDGRTLEYRVEHPRWRAWNVSEGRLEGDAAAIYGEAWGKILREAPVSAFIAEGSAIAAHRGQKI